MDAILTVMCSLTISFSILGIYFAIIDFATHRAKQRAAADGSGRGFGVSVKASSTANALAPSPESSRWSDRLRRWTEQSGVRISLAALFGLSCLTATISAVLVLLLHSWWLAAITSLVTAWLPFGLLAILRYRRNDRLRAQLPDALDLMSRMLRAGQTITQSLRGVADEFESPIADEFGYCYEQQNLGLSTDASMYEMARRTGVLELRILVVALTIHRQAGGNLSELLDNLAKVIRDRYRIQGQIRALTADGRLQAAILLALPPFLLVVLSVLNRDYVSILYQFPWLLVGMFGFEIFGALWLHRIVSFDF